MTRLPVRPAPADAQARVARWRPQRAGIVNVWRYYDETFHFHRGRLLLRGRNGTGKSKALELLLPYLLDANLQARRLSTFGGPERTMHWNLMGDGASGQTRVGYVWIEFRFGALPETGETGPTGQPSPVRPVGDGDGVGDGGREGGGPARPDDGTDGSDDGIDGSDERWFTCGARLQASVHTASATANYFTTTSRIGLPGGLSVVDEANAPLTRKRLEAELGDTGQLYPTAADYRAAIRAELFGGLSEQRYSGLITAMLQLRTPKLSERLDPSLLSTLLSRALPPLGGAEIAELAEGFERLDRQRESLRRLDEEVEAARVLADRQRAYASRVLRAAAADLISATSTLDALTRTARESQEEYDRVVAEREALDERITAAETDRGTLQARVEGLQVSDAYRAGGRLDELRGQVRAAQRRAADTREQATGAQERARVDKATATRTATGAARAEAELASARETARPAADRAGMTATYQQLAAVTERAAGAGEDREDAAASWSAAATRPRSLLRAAVEARGRQIGAVRRALGEHRSAVDTRTTAERNLERARQELTAATAARRDARVAYEDAREALGEALARWAASCAQLRFTDPGALRDAAESEPDVLRLVEETAGPLLEAIAARSAELAREHRDRDAERDAHTAERDRLLILTELPPSAPPTRTADRAGLPGAPLWRLVSFRDGVAPAVQAGIEAALEAAGLLDAWVFPTGGLTVPGHDTVIDVDRMAPAPAGGLGAVLTPEPDAKVPAERVLRLLAGIAVDTTVPDGHPVAVGADGTWRLAAARGSWSKPEPAHIGALARDRARRRRVDELTRLISQLDDVLAGIGRELGELGARRERIAAERRARPSHRALDTARGALEAADAAVAARDDVVSHRLEEVREGEDAVRAATRALTAAGAEHGLPTDTDALEAVQDAATAFHRLADGWLDCHQRATAARDAAVAAAGVATRSQESALGLAATAGDAAGETQRLRAKLDGIEAAIGPEYRQVLDEIAGARRRLEELAKQRVMMEQSGRALERRVGELDERRVVDADRREAAVAERDSRANRFRHLGAGSLAADTRLDIPLAGLDGVRPTLEAARAVAARLTTTPYARQNLKEAETRLTDAVHRSRQALADRAELVLEPDEDIQILTAAVDGIRVGAAHLHDAVRDERERSRAEITEGERELFDRTLTGNTRRHVADRIRQANALVADMNSRLERVRTASRTAVQIQWRVDPALPAATRGARDLLLRDPSQLTKADHEALHEFLRARVDDARDDDTATGWEEQLLRVFDYTAWHQFIVRVDRGNERGWQPLTKKLHGALSGGEKAIALHLPLFAALAAHYQSAPTAPRLILLDEVFVGVDTTNRGQVFELLASLDLDLMITSDHEWCMYRELDGIAIHSLITGDGSDDAVTTARFTWDGLRLTDADGQPL
ncbi:hypothetical protein FrCorBMG51_09690 [Protofrankia coriariae]|uniref:TIGR02680 family protein n=1 Tax=Protofrankia coriariae TaxID=1562887 RepID=A0ABR5F4V6_9ACTN|nr:hypothetical protein FrCorBMG51_09690 [Protofrankia coriariae]